MSELMVVQKHLSGLLSLVEAGGKNAGAAIKSLLGATRSPEHAEVKKSLRQAREAASMMLEQWRMIASELNLLKRELRTPRAVRKARPPKA